MSLRNYAASLLLGLYLLSPTGCSRQQPPIQLPVPPSPKEFSGKLGNEEVYVSERYQDSANPYRFTMIRIRNPNGQIDIYIDKHSDGIVEEHRTVVNRKGHFNPITHDTNKTFKKYLDAVKK